MTRIADLRDGDKKVGLEAEVFEIKERTTKSGKRVADITIQDASGKGTLVLWEDQIDEVKEGDAVRVENGYATAYQGKVQLNVGQYGHLTNLGQASEPPKQGTESPYRKPILTEDRVREIVAEELSKRGILA